MISVENLTKVFEKADRKLTAIKGLSLDIREGDFFCITGPSGCGKTTLLRIIAGLEEPTEGRVLMEGKEICGTSADRAMVFQEFALFPWRTVVKNIEFGLEVKGLPREERRLLVQRHIKLVGLEGFEQAYPSELSSGMKQRVALARALANNPRVMLMDEPLGSLDAQTRNFMQRELLKIWIQAKKTVVFVTHSVDEAVYLADRIAILTARPASLKKVTSIPMPRPRNRVSEEALNIRREILAELEVEVEQSLKSRG